eukprot:4972607-Pleurochrysis_carterae.AAC.1
MPQHQVLKHQFRDVQRVGVQQLWNNLVHVKLDGREGKFLLPGVRSGVLSANAGVYAFWSTFKPDAESRSKCCLAALHSAAVW